jgi:hypothetical protein
MAAPPKLTEGQRRQQIQRLLRPTGHETRLMKAKAWLFEAAMEAGEPQTAEASLSALNGVYPTYKTASHCPGAVFCQLRL